NVVSYHEDIAVEQPNEESDTAIPGIEQLTKPNPETIPATVKTNDGRFYSPLVKSIAEQEGIRSDELERIPGSGAEGRVTKQDILEYVSSRGARPATTMMENVQSDREEAPREERQSNVPPVRIVSDAGGDEVIEMDRMRRLIADH